MRRWVCGVCLAACAGVAALGLMMRGALPLGTHALVAEKYSGWSGVLRIWAAEEAEGYNGWMNRRIGEFEKSHEGVYVQIRYVSRGALETMGESGIRPPDMVLLGRDGLSFECLPVVYDEFAWALNRGTVQRVPQDWTGLRVGRLPDGVKSWSMAMDGLCSGLFPVEGAEIVLPDVDLGLGGSSSIEESPAERAPCVMTEDVVVDADAVAMFARGELDALVVSEDEIRRLERLSEKGQCVDWVKAESGENPYREVCLQIGLIPGSDVWATQRQSLCAEFITQLCGG